MSTLTEEQKLSKYLSPYTSEVDSDLQEMYLTKYVKAELAAYWLWRTEIPKLAQGHNLKALSTGAESTTFQSLSDWYDYCNNQAEAYLALWSDSNGASGTFIASVQGGDIFPRRMK